MEATFKRGPGRPRKADIASGEPDVGKPVLAEAKRGHLQVRMLKKYFPHGGGKIEKGGVVKLPSDEAVRAIDLGIAERADAYNFED